MTTEPTQVVDGQRLAGIRVLLVEDDPDTREVVAALLHQAGATVRAVSTGAAALFAFEQFGCDVVVTDYALPAAMTGYDLTRRIRTQPVDAHIPVVGYSAHGDLVSAREQEAFTAYMPKPEILLELVAIVADVVGKTSHE
jgi:CheY-like chemotaxis protein